MSMHMKDKEKGVAPASAPITMRNHPLWLAALGVLLLTFFCYLPVFSDTKSFTNWDDDQYITAQPLIRSLSGANIRKMFDPQSVVVFNYHPLTVLSLAIDYSRGYDEDTASLSISPFVHTNVFFHLLNTLLVLLFIYRLGKGNLYAAGFCALLFGIHPMHVESVAWISERKDVLYCFFFLLSALAYLRYLDLKQYGWLAASVLFFTLSCLCKAMAVPLPFVLLLTDYLYERRLSLRLAVEKLPYFIIALAIGLVTLTAQKGAIGLFTYTVPQRLAFAGSAFCAYWLKLLFPLRLSAFYPYPGLPLPAIYYAAPLLALAIIALPLVTLFRKDRAMFRVGIWGIGFFLLMIALVLPFISVGGTIMADRYTYVAAIGLFFVAGTALSRLNGRPRQVAMAGTIALLVFYASQTYSRIPVWENSGTLWADVIAQYPIGGSAQPGEAPGVKTPYKNMGDYYVTEENYDSAFYYYQALTKAGTRDAEVWINVGNIYLMKNRVQEALNAFDTSVKLDDSNGDAWLTRGLMLANTGNLPEAVKSLDRAIELKPGDTQARAMRTHMIRRLAK